MSAGVGTYYDRLGRWTQVSRLFGYGGGRDTFTVHRALADPSHGGAPTFTRLHDVLLEHLPSGRPLRVLDAGCGLGGTMMAIAAARDASCVGVTLSPSQVQAANAEAGRRGLGDRVQATVCSYDSPPPGPYDVVVAIESLAHSPDPSRTIAALAHCLAPGGVLLVVDDMPEPSAQGAPDLQTFKAGWQCPVLWSAEDYRQAFDRLALEGVDMRDLTLHVRPRSLPAIALLTALNRAAAWVPSEGFRHMLASYRGGLALERLTRRGQVRYQLLVARKPALQVS